MERRKTATSRQIGLKKKQKFTFALAVNKK
jgi:hypothetical protein